MVKHKIYCLDTSAFIESWQRYYPIDSFPGIWNELESLIKNKRIIAPKEVLLEIRRKDDDLHKWIKNNEDIFIELDDDFQKAVSEIMTAFPKLVDERSGKSSGDPFVIALAKIRKTPVITYEKGGTEQRPKIPNVCNHYKIPCFGFIDLIQIENWKF